MMQRILSSRRPLQLLIVALYPLAVVTWKTRSHKRKRVVPRRVVHVSPAYFGDQSYVGGGERGALGLATAMAEHADIDTRFVSFGPTRRSYRRGSLRVEIYPMRGSVDNSTASPISYAFLWELLRADVVHCHQFQTPTIQLAILAGVILDKRVVVTDHAAIVRGFTNKLPISRLVDVYLAESVFTLKVLPPFPKVRMIYGGVGERFLDPVEETPREPMVLFVGRLVPHKGVNYLIEAVGDDIPLDVIGRPYDEKYFSLLRSLAEHKKVRFITDASDDDIMAAYGRATVTVLPSVYDDVYGRHNIAPELLGLALVESMARGTPAICTDVGGMPEYVEDGVTGFVTPPNSPTALRERIDYLLRNPGKARAMGRRARQRALEKFTWDAAARRALAAYKDV